MSLLKIRNYPDPILYETAESVDEVDKEVKTLLDDMVETMYEAKGIGLAAPQIGISKRIIVVDVGEEPRRLFKLVNPEIVATEGSFRGEEGCLSIPDVRETVERSERVTVHGLDENGKEVSIEADGLLSVCLQHEIDHLDGVLFIDRLSRVRKQLVKGKLKKLLKKS